MGFSLGIQAEVPFPRGDVVQTAGDNQVPKTACVQRSAALMTAGKASSASLLWAQRHQTQG